MEALAWTLRILLAAVFLASASKWAADRLRGRREALPELSNRQVAALASVEVAGAIGVTLPAALGVAPVLTPLAAIGLAVLMVAAARRNLTHDGAGDIPFNVVIGVMALAVAALRLGPLA